MNQPTDWLYFVTPHFEFFCYFFCYRSSGRFVANHTASGHSGFPSPLPTFTVGQLVSGSCAFMGRLKYYHIVPATQFFMKNTLLSGPMCLSSFLFFYLFFVPFLLFHDSSSLTVYVNKMFLKYT